jgi:hypothetical protein
MRHLFVKLNFFSDTKEMVTVLKARGNHDKVALEFSKDYKKHFLLKERKGEF